MDILIIEDDKEINNILSVYLNKHDYATVSSYDGVDGLNKIIKNEYSLILLDMMLPGFSGNELIGKIRRISDVPIIVISAVSALDERLYMMKNGADDYIIKPFELPDVLARIEAVLRRYNKNVIDKTDKETAKVLTYGNIKIDTSNNTISVNGEELLLTSKELDILKLMMKYPKKIFSKANLYESIWNEEYFPEDKSLKVHMSNLRSKLKSKDDFDYIETIWGMGYRLRKLPESS